MKRKPEISAIEEEDGSSEDSADELSDDFGVESGDENEDIAQTKAAGKQAGKNGQPPQKMAKLSQADLYKPPTNEELNSLKETKNLFHSSLFRMQITELLTEVVLKEKRRKQVDEYLDKLKDVLLGLPSQKEHDITDQKWAIKKKIQVPFLQEPFQVKGKFKFCAPTSVNVMGSYVLGTCVRPDISIDVALQLPADCLQAKDYLNQRYLRKRALYLTKLAVLLQGKDIVGDLSFTYHHGNHMKPILVITPAGKQGSHVQINVHTYIDDETFKLNRFHIHKNNVRTSWYNNSNAAEDSAEGPDASAQPATPHYNTAMLTDLVSQRHLEVAREALSDAGGVKDGIALLKVWLHQRQLDKGYGAFSGFIMTMYVVQLLRQRKLNRVMSSYQVVRNTLLQLSQSDWASEGITMATSSVDLLAPTLEDFNDAFDVVFVDPTGYVNLCSAMFKSTFQRVQHEAKLSLQFIDTPGLDGFEALFMKPVPFMTKFDQAFHVFDVEGLSSCPLCPEAEVLDQCGDHVAVLSRHLLHLVDRAAARRLELAAVQLQPQKKWSVTEGPPKSSGITVGLLLNPETVGSAVDKGPLADSPQAEDFRQFWGDKAELRRFQDGTICEAAVWKCSSVADRRFILLKVLKHILKSQGGVNWERVKFMAGQLDPLIGIQSLRGSGIKYRTGEEQHTAVLQAYDQLSKVLRGLRELPLAIHSIQGTSPALRYAETFPPLVATAPATGRESGQRMVPGEELPCPTYTPAVTVQCILEGSGKWPEDVGAVRRLRAAFHVQLAGLLSDKHSLPAHPYADHLLVFKDGFVFRVQIGYLREITLLKMVKTPEGMLKMLDTDESQAMEKQLVTLPMLSSALHGLQQEHPSYSAAVRLAKRWISSQLLADYISEESTELLMAHLYLQPAPFTAPGSPLVAFQRWLHLVGYHDWQLVPIIVNLNKELTKKDYAAIEFHFTQHRSTLPLMFIASPYDRLKSTWTRQKPGPQIMQRLVLLARESLNTLQEQLKSTEIHVDYKLIFRPPLDSYNVLIHLNKRHVPRRYQAVDTDKSDSVPKYVPLEEAPDSVRRRLPVVNYDPVVCYLKELRESFGEVAMFFYDSIGGSYIAVLWKRPSLEPQPFRVSHAAARSPDMSASKDDLAMVPNLNAIIEDFKIMGAGLVKDVKEVLISH